MRYMNTVINAAIIKDDKILLVKKRDAWILPEGKLNSNESDLECLSKEIAEKLSGAKLEVLCYYGDFFGYAHHEKYELITKVYLAYLVEDEFKPSSEISAAWVDDTTNYSLSDVTVKIINALKGDEYL